MKKSFRNGVLLLILFLISGLNMIYAQQKSISGSVRDESNISLPGVTVVVKGTTTGTVTNNDGAYNINVPDENATLIFSFIGMETQEFKVGTQSTINVSMESGSIGLDEVIAIGYGTSKRQEVTGAVAVADLDELRKVPVNNILETVKGAVPGLIVGSTNRAGQVAGLQVRGQNSVNDAGNVPLIVVDNAIYHGSLGDIANQDIESFTVLKDASAAAVYGARSANGVILITTKKGNGINGKPQFNANLSYGVINEMEPLAVYDAEGYIKRMLDIRELNGLEANPANVADYFVSAIERENYLATSDHQPTVVDPYDLIRQNGFNKKADFSVSNRTENSSYYISTSLTDQEGVIINDSYKNFTGRINISNDLTDWLNVSINTMYSFRDYSGSTPPKSSTVGISPYANVYNEDGSYVHYPQQTTSYVSPFWQIATVDLDQRNNLNAIVKGTIKVPWVEGLTYTSTYSKSLRWNETSQFWDKNTHDGELAKSMGSRSYSRSNNMLFDNMLNFKRLFADKHKVDVTLLYSWEESSYESLSGSSEQFDNDVLLDYKLENGIIQNVNTGGGESGSIGQMARASYTYDQRYVITGTVRRDGFSAFSKNKKWGVFPSVAVMWNISKENFLNNIDVIDHLSVRVSYGSNGNQSIDPYSTLAQVGTGKYLYDGDQTYSLTQAITSFALNDLSWETTTGWNYGINFGILNNRISGTIDAYKSNTTNQLFNLSLPYITGGSSIKSNLGDIENKGIEIGLHTLNIKKNDFEWTSDFVFSRNRNKVITIYGNDNDGDGIEDDLISDNIFIGKSLGQIYTYKVIGMWQQEDVDNGTIFDGMNPGTYKLEDLPDENGEYDGKITSTNDRQHIGNSKANFRWSLNNNFLYKDFSLMVYLYSVWGGNGYYLSGANQPENDPYPYREDVNKVVYDYWALDNTDGIFPRPDSQSKAAVKGVKYYDRSFIKLQKISLGYDATRFVKSTFIKGLNLSVSGDNLFTYAPHWIGLDPETNQGIRDDAVPSLQSFIFTVAFKF